MEIFAPFFLCAIFLAIMYGLMRLTLYFSNLSARRSIMQSGNYTAKTVHALLYAYFGSKYLKSHVHLPRRTKYGTAYDKYDHILILNGNAVIIKICEENGKIDNLSGAENWYMYRRTRTGDEKQIVFENPIAATLTQKKALSELFENSEIDAKVSIETLIIFPSRRIKFSIPRQKEILSPPEAISKLLEMNKKPGLTKNDKDILIKSIRRFSRSASYAAAKNRKLRHR